MDVYISGNYAYIADRNAGLQVVDISIPTSPTLVSAYDIEGKGGALSIYAAGNYAYLTDSWCGLLTPI